MTRVGKGYVREFIAIHSMICDLCKKEYGPGKRPKVTIESEDECYSEESDDRSITVIDVCSPCFLSMVKPAIEALGGAFRTYAASDDGANLNYQKVIPRDR